MTPRERLAALARLPAVQAPVVSAYLGTRWADEHQRERVRVFMKNELRRARAGDVGSALAEDLDWVEGQIERVINQDELPDARGVALFACTAQGLRVVVPVRVSFAEAFVVADRPHLGPLAAALDAASPIVVAFVDGEHARLIAIHADGPAEEARLERKVPGRHSRGGWALLAQSRNQRHIEAHRGQHFDAVAEALARLADVNGMERIVLAGEARTLAVFRQHLPQSLRARLLGTIAAARYEPAATLVERAAALVAGAGDGEGRAVEDVLIEAAKGGRAVAGVEQTMAAITCGAVHRLYLLKGFQPPEAGEAAVERVLATGGTVEMVETHPDLGRVGGMAARLRYRWQPSTATPEGVQHGP